MQSNVMLLQLLVLMIAHDVDFNPSSSQLFVRATLSCTNDAFCAERIREGSVCLFEQQSDLDEGSEVTVTGVCSNPYSNGCLKPHLDSLPFDLKESLLQRFPHVQHGRICNSDDNGDFEDDQNECISPEFSYPEIRIHNGNLESNIFLAWIHQIVLMELADVPVTVGMGRTGGKKNRGLQDNTYDASFYNPMNAFPYASVGYAWDALGVASRVGDCRQLSRRTQSSDYVLSTSQIATSPSELEEEDKVEGCVHVLPEVWNGQSQELSAALRKGVIDPTEGNGEVGRVGWYIPAYTADHDQTLLSYYGLRGEENRRKIASTFKRPLTWKDYCEIVSSNNCTEPDDTAKRYPKSDSEESSYFSSNTYTGYFHLGDKNNCTKNPTTCSGVIIGPPCTASNNIEAQIYWNDLVGLEPDGPIAPNRGYSYSSMAQIWRAANATTSHVLMWWWKPEPLTEEFHGTTYNFENFLLPEANDVCVKSRLGTDERCSEDITVRRGQSEGACGHEAQAVQKVYASSLREQHFVETNLAYRSPGYPTIQGIKISDLQINNVLRRWLELEKDRYGSDAREAVCTWVVENLDLLVETIPLGYPRILDNESSSHHLGYQYAAIAVAAFTILVALAGMTGAYYYRKSKAMQFAKVDFMMMVLTGFLLISLASLIVALKPSPASCTITAWLVALGYTIEMVPLLVKAVVINKILNSAKKMKRIYVSRCTMYRTVLSVVGVIALLLVVRTSTSPFSLLEQRIMPINSSEFDPVVQSKISCDCKNYRLWKILGFVGHCILLAVASVVAYQSRNVRQGLNECRSLGTMVYSHFIFLILRLAVFLMNESHGGRGLFASDFISSLSSYLYSVDALTALSVYIVPKFQAAISVPSKNSGTQDNMDSTSQPGGVYQSEAINEIQQNAARARASWISQNNGSFKDGLNGSKNLKSISFNNYNNSNHSSDISFSSSSFKGSSSLNEKRASFGSIPADLMTNTRSSFGSTRSSFGRQNSSMIIIQEKISEAVSVSDDGSRVHHDHAGSSARSTEDETIQMKGGTASCSLADDVEYFDDNIDSEWQDNGSAWYYRPTKSDNDDEVDDTDDSSSSAQSEDRGGPRWPREDLNDALTKSLHAPFLRESSFVIKKVGGSTSVRSIEQENSLRFIEEDGEMIKGFQHNREDALQLFGRRKDARVQDRTNRCRGVDQEGVRVVASSKDSVISMDSQANAKDHHVPVGIRGQDTKQACDQDFIPITKVKTDEKAHHSEESHDAVKPAVSRTQTPPQQENPPKDHERPTRSRAHVIIPLQKTNATQSESSDVNGLDATEHSHLANGLQNECSDENSTLSKPITPSNSTSAQVGSVYREPNECSSTCDGASLVSGAKSSISTSTSSSTTTAKSSNAPIADSNRFPDQDPPQTPIMSPGSCARLKKRLLEDKFLQGHSYQMPTR